MYQSNAQPLSSYKKVIYNLMITQLYQRSFHQYPHAPGRSKPEKEAICRLIQPGKSNPLPLPMDQGCLLLGGMTMNVIQAILQ